MPHSPVQRFYRLHACIYDATRWAFLYGRRQAIDALALQPNHTVLEIGCGTGLNFKHILRRLDPRQGRLIGLDFSEHMLRQARRRTARPGYENVTLLQADATQLSLGEQFDAILFAYSLSMIPDWQAALKQARDHLKPNGRLVLLDFGTFDKWGPFGSIARAWLRLNHVETARPYLPTLRQLFDSLEAHTHLGGCCFIATGSIP